MVTERLVTPGRPLSSRLTALRQCPQDMPSIYKVVFIRVNFGAVFRAGKPPELWAHSLHLDPHPMASSPPTSPPRDGDLLVPVLDLSAGPPDPVAVATWHLAL